MPRRTFAGLLVKSLACMLMLAAGAGISARAQDDGAQSGSIVNDTARILAGLHPNPSSPLAAVANSPGFTGHAHDMENAWDTLERTRLSRMRQWASANLPGRSSSRPIYYPFSGPDILHLYTFYPSAPTYALCGLEPVGSVPNLAGIPPEQLAGGLAQVRGSLNSLLRYTYFMTKEMRADFGGNRFGGVVPVLLLMLARSGCEIKELSYVQLNANGSVGPAARGRGNGVRIVFRGRGGSQELFYFSYNLSDGGATAYINFMRGHGLGQTYLKAASYLMHSGNFTRIREGIFANSQTILQDDSGIPYRYFVQKPNWRLQFFGNYTKPITLFASQYQADLREVYTNHTEGIKELSFGIGYFFWGNQSNLMLATRTGGGGAPPPSSAGAPAADNSPLRIFRLQRNEEEPAAPPAARPKRRVRDDVE